MIRDPDPTGLEMRVDRSYDEQTPSHVLHPNGTAVDSYHRGFLRAAAREVLRLRGVDLIERDDYEQVAS